MGDLRQAKLEAAEKYPKQHSWDAAGRAMAGDLSNAAPRPKADSAVVRGGLGKAGAYLGKRWLRNVAAPVYKAYKALTVDAPVLAIQGAVENRKRENFYKGARSGGGVAPEATARLIESLSGKGGRWVTAEQVRNARKQYPKVSSNGGLYNPSALDPADAALRPLPPTAPVKLSEVSVFVYGVPDYAENIRKANSIRTSVGGIILNESFWCPVIQEETPGTPPTESNASAVPFYPKPEWIDRERAIVEGYSDGLAVVVFYRETSGARKYAHQRVKGFLSLSSRSSVFEAARALEISFPIGFNVDDPALWLFGNHVACAHDGEVFFMGILTKPSVGVQKGVTATWVAQSHTYRALNTHFNPLTVPSDMSNMLPADVLRFISNDLSVPVIIADEALKLLNYDNSDENGIKGHNDQDVLGTTPIKTIQRLLMPANLFASCNEEGQLYIAKMDLNQTSLYQFFEGDPELGRFELAASYNFDELAQTYTVLGQRRTQAVSQAEYQEFPIPSFFKNVVRQNVVMFEDNLAKFEVSKALANGVDIKLTVPEWEIPGTKSLWSPGDMVDVFSPTFGIMESLTSGSSYVQFATPLVVTAVVLEWSKDWKRTELTLTLPGVFDIYFPTIIPFLTAPDESLTVTSKYLDVKIQNEQNLEEGEEEDSDF